VTLFDGVTPQVASFNDVGAVELGVKFRSSQNGVISAVRFYRGATNPAGYTVKLYSSTGAELARATGPEQTAAGWNELAFATPVPITAGTTYVATYFSSNGGYAVTQNYFTVDRVQAPLTAPSAASSNGNGLFFYGPAGGFPTASFSQSNYFVDVRFRP
jgi:hypothetical protein